MLGLKTFAVHERLHGYAITSLIQATSADLLRVEEGSLSSPDGSNGVRR